MTEINRRKKSGRQLKQYVEKTPGEDDITSQILQRAYRNVVKLIYTL